MYTEFNYALKARESATTTPKNYFTEEVIVEPEEGFGGSYKYADSVSEVAFSLGTIAVATFVYIYSDIDIEIFLGDPATTDPIKTSFLVKNVTELDNGFTALYIKNNNGEGTVANVDVYVAGDITA